MREYNKWFYAVNKYCVEVKKGKFEWKWDDEEPVGFKEWMASEKNGGGKSAVAAAAAAAGAAPKVVDAAGESSIKAGNRYKLSVGASEAFTVTASA